MKGTKIKSLPYLVAIVLVIFTFALKLELNSFIDFYEAPFLLSIITVILSSFYGGVKAGIVTTVLSAAVTIFFLNNGNFLINRSNTLVKLALFTIEGSLASGLVGRLRNMNKKSALEVKLANESESYVRKILDEVGIFVGVINGKGQLIEVNRTALEISKLTIENVVGKKIEDTFWWSYSIESKKLIKEAVCKSLHGEKVRFDIAIKIANLTFSTIDLTLSPVKDDKGEVQFVIASAIDISERVRLDNEKDELIRIASHELKTPLTTVKAYAQILEKRTNENDQSYKYLNKMNMYVDRLTKIIYDFLDFSKIQSDKLDFNPEEFNINDLIKGVAEDMQATTETHQITTVINPTEAMVLADKDRISQVLINLIQNAIKYSPNSDRIEVLSSSIKDKVIISVKDFGIGIPAQDQKNIFNEFYRVSSPKKIKIEGFGLGLYISAQIVKQHGGKIGFESKENYGSTFYFSLPMIEDTYKN